MRREDMNDNQNQLNDVDEFESLNSSMNQNPMNWNQGYPNQMNQNQGYPNQMNQNQGYPNQMNQNQGYPEQMDQNQDYIGGRTPEQIFDSDPEQMDDFYEPYSEESMYPEEPMYTEEPMYSENAMYTEEPITEQEYEQEDAASVKEESMDKKKKNKKKMDPLSKVILIIAVIVFIGSGGFLAYKYIAEPILEKNTISKYSTGDESGETNSAEEGVWKRGPAASEERLEDGTLASFKDIRAANSDVVGWISIPGTDIDYPITQTDNNMFYLIRDIAKKESKAGNPFVDYRDKIEPDYMSKCTLIYGHHRQNGTMFAQLTNYDDIEFYKSNPVFRFDTIYKRAEWVVFANFRTTASPATGKPFNYLKTSFDSDEAYLQFIEEIKKRSLIDTPIEVAASDDIVLLSTCSYERQNWRQVIAARRVHDDENTIDVSTAKMAENPLMP